MQKHWLITYQQRNDFDGPWIPANTATKETPPQWLFEALNQCPRTILLFALEITSDEYAALRDVL